MKRALIWSLVWAAAAALVLSGCGGDSAEADQRRFCELIQQYNKGTGFEPPPEDTPPGEQQEALAAALRDYLRLPEIAAITDELPRVAPDEVRADVESMVEVAEHLAETGESRFEDDDAMAANGRIVEYTSANCTAPGDAEQDDDADAGARDDAGDDDADAEARDDAGDEGTEGAGASDGGES